MHCLDGWKTGFQISVTAADGPLGVKLESDPDPYLAGVKRFCKMFKTCVEPVEHRRFLAPIAVLEAMARSVATGRLVPVAKV
jgi:hypothetical protein